ncbi:glycosyltransferase family 2 protein [Phaeobacter marinintestinus]|uniref:glycosyltransferase family 2 protein n=1 Tax=Falsiphaeobacter marinintestinus TaxID=1492905 RepID=UPI0011B3EE16|nr:glycosyltransferase family 2 protein [Phaeobacter marinintestinus]
MSPSRNSWTVVSTVSEPLPLLQAFVAHHLAMGADQVVLHFDTDDQIAMQALGSIEGCRVEPPVDRKSGRRTPVPVRQVLNATRSYEQAETEWLLHIDADEFLVAPDDVHGQLADLPETVVAAGVTPLDRVWLLETPPTEVFDGLFRRLPSPDQMQALEDVYRADLRYLDGGFSGNGAFKSFVRTGLNVKPGVHGPTGPDGQELPVVNLSYPAGLLHFDGLTPAHYLAKMQRKIAQQPGWFTFPAPGRRAQLEEIWRAGADTDRLDRLVASCKMIDAEQADALDAMGLLRREPFDVRPALEAVFAGQDIDLSIKSFDAVPLKQRHIGRVKQALYRLRSWYRVTRGF